MVFNPEHPGTSNFGPMHRIRKTVYRERNKETCREGLMRETETDETVASRLSCGFCASICLECQYPHIL